MKHGRPKGKGLRCAGPNNISALLKLLDVPERVLAEACDPPLAQNRLNLIKNCRVDPSINTAKQITKGLRKLLGRDLHVDEVFPL